jgi:ribose transport system permease protein
MSTQTEARVRTASSPIPSFAASGLSALRRSGIVLPFIGLLVVLSFVSPSFATQINLTNILDQQSAILIIACAGTLVFITGGLDLSVGATYALAAVITADLAQHHNLVVALAAGLLVGALAGLVNGLVVTVLSINSLIATLATSFVIGGLAALLTSGNSITLYDNEGYGKLAGSILLELTSAVWIMMAVAVALGLALWGTPFGRRAYAVGGNASAARLAGLRVIQIRVLAFVLSGVAAAAGGLIDSSRVLSAQSSAGGDALTFTVIAGIVVGGTSIHGGEGAIWRTVLGVLFLALVGNGYNLLGLDPLYQRITLGVLILLAVGLERLVSLARQGGSWTRHRLRGAA